MHGLRGRPGREEVVSMTKRAVALAAVCLAVSTSAARADDDAERRAKIAKLARLVWCDRGKPIAFCDLDGTNVVRSEHPGVGFDGCLRVLPDGRRVLLCGGGKVRVVDSRDASEKDLTADAPGEEFPARPPQVSPDGRYAVFWHGPRRDHFPAEQTSYAVFDLETGSRTLVGPLQPPSIAATWGRYEPPTAWWSPDGDLYASVAAPPPADDKTWKLVRWSPATKERQDVAALPPGTRATQMAFHGERMAYVVAPETNQQFIPVVRAGDGSKLFELTENGLIWGLRWEEDGAALRLRVQPPVASPVTYFLRVAPGKPAERVTEFEPPPRASFDGGWIEERRIDVAREKRDGWVTPESELWRVAANGEAKKIGLGSSPRRVGEVVVFWRVSVPVKNKEGPYFEMPQRIPGSDDLWAYDPKDGAQIRLTTCGFDTQCWDLLVAPAARTR
jgi:hypothetical protein